MSVPESILNVAKLSADLKAVEFVGTFVGPSSTLAIVERTLEALEANGYIKYVPEDERPQFYTPRPPYKNIIVIEGVNRELLDNLDPSRSDSAGEASSNS